MASRVLWRCRQVSQLPQGLGNLVEVAEQALAAAAGGFRTGRAGRRAWRGGDALPAPARLVDEAALLHQIGHAVGHPGFGGLAVAAGAAGFLVVALDGAGQVQVGDEAHIGLVDAHPEGDGGDHHDAVLAQEAVLVGGPLFGAHARVVGQGGDAFPQPGGGLIHFLRDELQYDASFAPGGRRG